MLQTAKNALDDAVRRGAPQLQQLRDVVQVQLQAGSRPTADDMNDILLHACERVFPKKDLDKASSKAWQNPTVQAGLRNLWATTKTMQRAKVQGQHAQGGSPEGMAC